MVPWPHRLLTEEQWDHGGPHTGAACAGGEPGAWEALHPAPVLASSSGEVGGPLPLCLLCWPPSLLNDQSI